MRRRRSFVEGTRAPLRRACGVDQFTEGTTYVEITTTTERRDDAERIATALLDARLAACVQIGAIVSRYRWKGAIERADEWRCTIKTRGPLVAHVERVVRAVHPYETPEFIVTPILTGGADYLAWIDTETLDPPAALDLT